MIIYDPDLYAVIKIRKIGWTFGSFVAGNLTMFEANQLCQLHNRWWKFIHYERVSPPVLRGLENDRLKRKNS